MKTSMLGLTLAISVMFTVPAGARGGYPPMVGPSYPYPSYCAQCGVWQAPPPPPRAAVRYHKERRHRTSAN